MLYASVMQLVTAMAVISVVVERCAEIIINGLNLDEFLQNQRLRKFFYHLMSMCIGSVVYYMNVESHSDLLGSVFSSTIEPVVAGLLVSSGSSFWHDVLKIFSNLSITNKKTVV